MITLSLLLLLNGGIPQVPTSTPAHSLLTGHEHIPSLPLGSFLFQPPEESEEASPSSSHSDIGTSYASDDFEAPDDPDEPASSGSPGEGEDEIELPEEIKAHMARIRQSDCLLEVERNPLSDILLIRIHTLSPLQSPILQALLELLFIDNCIILSFQCEDPSFLAFDKRAQAYKSVLRKGILSAGAADTTETTRCFTYQCDPVL